MERKDQPTTAPGPERLPQFKVQTGLRGGASLEDCQKNLKYWQDEYYANYQIVLDKLAKKT